MFVWILVPVCPATPPADIFPNVVSTNCTLSPESGINRTRGDACQFTCPLGYIGSDAVLFCQEDGQWSIPTNYDPCEIIDCGPLPPLPDGVIIDCTNQTTFEQQCSAFCEDGFTQPYTKSEENNSSSNFPFFGLTCSENGHWVGSPSCERVDCGPLPLWVEESNSTVNISSCTLVDARYHFPSLNNTTVQTGWNSSTVPTVFGTKCSSLCSSNFGLAGIPDSALACSASGNWQIMSKTSERIAGAMSPQACLPIVCEDTFVVVEGESKAVCLDNEIGATCNATCQLGFRQISSEPFTCTTSGRFKGGSIICEPITCPGIIPGLGSKVIVNDCVPFTFEVGY